MPRIFDNAMATSAASAFQDDIDDFCRLKQKEELNEVKSGTRNMISWKLNLRELCKRSSSATCTWARIFCELTEFFQQ